jgi:hypothetical protein
MGRVYCPWHGRSLSGGKLYRHGHRRRHPQGHRAGTASAEREQQQAAEQERQARERAGHVDKVWPYLERYQEAMRLKYSPSILECVKPKILRNGDKVVIRDAWRISTHYGDADQIGQRARYRLWLDAMSPDLWWQTD